MGEGCAEGESRLGAPGIGFVLLISTLDIYKLDKAQKTTKRGGSDFLDVFFHYLTTHYKILN